MKFVARMTDKRLKSLEADAACGVVPGLSVRVRKLSDGSLRKYFVLRFQSGKLVRILSIGNYPEMSLTDAFKKAQVWRDKLTEGIDPVEEEKARLQALKTAEERAEDEAKRLAKVLTFEKLIRQWIDFNEKRGKWKNATKTKSETWDGFFRNHIPESIRTCPVVDLTPEMFSDALSEKWRTMVDTPERLLGDARCAIDWAMRSSMIPPMINPCQIKDGRLGDLLRYEKPI